MESEIQRRHVVGGLLGGVGGIASLLASGQSNAANSKDDNSAVFCSELTIPPSLDGKNQIRQFVRTNVQGGHVFCTLTEQDNENPAITSVFATPVTRKGEVGAEIAINFLGDPRGNVTMSVLHVGSQV
ncbi:hypothetical protein [Rhodopirellula sallentina]|nr:hypothetical protein [Rhodopirellula sallentina]